MERTKKLARVSKGMFAFVLVVIALLALVSCGQGQAGNGAAAHGELLNRVYEESRPSIVKIVVRGVPRDGIAPGVSLGTGFVIDDEGHIATNEHVVRFVQGVLGEAGVMNVILADGLALDVKMVGSDLRSDFALLKVDVPPEELQPICLGDSDSVKVGQLAVAIGHPFDLEFTMTSGIISGVGRTVDISGTFLAKPWGMIQTDAAINPGNSGGPLLNLEGCVIGINSQIEGHGIGFALPINAVKQIVPDLIRDGHYDYPWLGIRYRTLPFFPEAAEAANLPRYTRGSLILAVAEGSPAEEAGFLKDDVIVAVGGKYLKGHGDLLHSLSLRRPGDKVTLIVIRKGELMQSEVILGKQPR